MKPLVVIPNYMRTSADLAMLEECLRTLRLTAGDRCDVMVVDDGSPAEDLITPLSRIVARYHADLDLQGENEGFCSPPDEPVLTTRYGYVPIGELDPATGLVSFRNDSSEVVVGNGNRGYSCDIARRPYDGPLLEISTRHGMTRVTPNHGIPIRWSAEARAKWCVYVMRRGRYWRMGKCQMVAHGGSLGARARMKHQDADAVWIVSLHNTEQDALASELHLSWHYGVPTMLFRTAGEVISQERLDDVWASLDTTTPALALLADHERDPALPLTTRSAGRRKRAAQYAANLMPGHMQVYVQNGTRGGYDTVLADFERSTGAYAGEVLSLDVRPHEHYVSGGVVVHNSKAVNVGLRRAREDGSDAILVNADIEFIDDPTRPVWLDAMLNQGCIGREGLASVVGAQLMYPTGLIQHAGIHFSLLTRSFDHRYRFGPVELPEAARPVVAPVTGALQFIRHECLVEVGPYDETFRLGWEDVDYCVRVWQSGRQSVYQPAIRAIHHESVFRGRRDEKISEWTEYSWRRFCAKHAAVNFLEFVPSMTMGEPDA